MGEKITLEKGKSKANVNPGSDAEAHFLEAGYKPVKDDGKKAPKKDEKE